MNLEDYKELQKMAAVSSKQIAKSKSTLDRIIRDKMENGTPEERKLFTEMMNDKDKLFKFVEGKGRSESDLKINEFLQKWQSIS
jgi:hypothetical protein